MVSCQLISISLSLSFYLSFLSFSHPFYLSFFLSPSDTDDWTLLEMWSVHVLEFFCLREKKWEKDEEWKKREKEKGREETMREKKRIKTLFVVISQWRTLKCSTIQSNRLRIDLVSLSLSPSLLSFSLSLTSFSLFFLHFLWLLKLVTVDFLLFFTFSFFTPFLYFCIHVSFFLLI